MSDKDIFWTDKQGRRRHVGVRRDPAGRFTEVQYSNPQQVVRHSKEIPTSESNLRAILQLPRGYTILEGQELIDHGYQEEEPETDIKNTFAISHDNYPDDHWYAYQIGNKWSFERGPGEQLDQKDYPSRDTMLSALRQDILEDIKMHQEYNEPIEWDGKGEYLPTYSRRHPDESIPKR